MSQSETSFGNRSREWAGKRGRGGLWTSRRCEDLTESVCRLCFAPRTRLLWHRVLMLRYYPSRHVWTGCLQGYYRTTLHNRGGPGDWVLYHKLRLVIARRLSYQTIPSSLLSAEEEEFDVEFRPGNCAPLVDWVSFCGLGCRSDPIRSTWTS
jgi:hypothetical protein